MIAPRGFSKVALLNALFALNLRVMKACLLKEAFRA
jgi:hypothetical protein